MKRFLVSLLLCLMVSFPCFADEASGNLVTMQNFGSVVVVVSQPDGKSLPVAEDWLSDELRVLKVAPVPEEVAWELYRITKKDNNEDRYRMYLGSSYDSILQADVFPNGSLFRIRFTMVSLKDVGMPILYQKEMEVSGDKEAALKSAFYNVVQEFVSMRSHVMVENPKAVGKTAD